MLSAAFRCGLIEATRGHAGWACTATGYPQHFAAASLKLALRYEGEGQPLRYPQHFAAASLKQLAHGVSDLRDRVIRSISLRPH